MRGVRVRSVAGAAVAASLALAVLVGAPPAQAAVPGAPTGLRAIPEENPIDPGQPLIRLRWVAPEKVGDGITGYRVYVDGELRETTRPVTCPAPTPTRQGRWCANVSNLVIGRTYTFEVTALSKAGESKPISVKRMAVVAPSEPLNVQVVPDNESLTVSWDPPLSTGGGTIRSYVVRTTSFRPGTQPPCARGCVCVSQRWRALFIQLTGSRC